MPPGLALVWNKPVLCWYQNVPQFLIGNPKMNICAQNLHNGNFKFTNSSSQNEFLYITLFKVLFLPDPIWSGL